MSEGRAVDERADLGQLAAFLLRQGHVLQRFPDLLFQQAANEAAESSPCRLAHRRAAGGRASRQWLRLRNKAAAADPCQLTLPARPGAGCVVSPDGRRVLFAERTAARLRDLGGGPRELVLEGHAATIEDCGYSPDGRHVVSVADDGLRLWDAATGAVVHSAELAPEAPTACAFAPDGVFIAIGFSSGAVGFFEALGSHSHFVLPAHARRVSACCWSSDASRLVTCSAEGSARLWNGLESTVVGRGIDGLASCAFSPDGQRFATAGPPDPMVRIWDVATRALVAQGEVRASANSPHTPGGQGGVAACAYSPDGGRLVVGCWDCSLRILDAESLAEICSLSAHGEPVVACAFTPDGRSIVSRDRAGIIKRFDVATAEGAGSAPRHGGMVDELWISRDGQRLASGGWDDSWRVWDVSTARCLGTEPHRAAAAPPPAACGPWSVGGAGSGDRRSAREVVSPDGARKAMIAPFGRGLDLLDAATGRRIAVLATPAVGRSMTGLTTLMGVTACAFSPDGATLAALSDEGTLNLWEAADGALLVRYPTAATGSAVTFTAATELVIGDAAGAVSFLRLERPFLSHRTGSAH